MKENTLPVSRWSVRGIIRDYGVRENAPPLFEWSARGTYQSFDLQYRIDLTITFDDSSIERRDRSRPRGLPCGLQQEVNRLNAIYDTEPGRQVALEDILSLVGAIRDHVRAWPLAERSTALEKIVAAIVDQGRGVLTIPATTRGPVVHDRVPIKELEILKWGNDVLDRLKVMRPARRAAWNRRLDAVLARMGRSQKYLRDHRRNQQRTIARRRTDLGVAVLEKAMTLPSGLATMEQQLEWLLTTMEQAIILLPSNQGIENKQN